MLAVLLAFTIPVSAVAVSLHLLVFVEEEQLHRIFGGRYREFQRQIPRYVGRRHSPCPAAKEQQ